MKKFAEFFQQQDGSFCILQLATGGGFGLFWLVWAYVCIRSHTIAECPVGLAGLLAAMLGAKVWKDSVDFKAPQVLPTPPDNSGFVQAPPQQ